MNFHLNLNSNFSLSTKESKAGQVNNGQEKVVPAVHIGHLTLTHSLWYHVMSKVCLSTTVQGSQSHVHHLEGDNLGQHLEGGNLGQRKGTSLEKAKLCLEDGRARVQVWEEVLRQEK